MAQDVTDLLHASLPDVPQVQTDSHLMEGAGLAKHATSMGGDIWVGLEGFKGKEGVPEGLLPFLGVKGLPPARHWTCLVYCEMGLVQHLLRSYLDLGSA